MAMAYHAGAELTAMEFHNVIVRPSNPRIFSALGAVMDADVPVVDARPDSVVEVLRGLIADPARRAALGAEGIAFVRRRHDTRVVAGELLQVYAGLMARDARPREGRRAP